MRLIVLPGLDGTGALSEPLCARLSLSHDVENVRYPGELFQYEDLARWLESRLGPGDFAIIAESFSGPLAIRLAATQPAGLKALILVASFARSPRRVPAFAAAGLYLLPLRSRLLIRLTRRVLVGKWGAQDFPETWTKIISTVPRPTLVGRLREVLRVNVTGQLSVIQCPRLLIVADRDRLVPVANTHDFSRHGWATEKVEGPHFLNLTRGEDVAERIEVFLEHEV